MARVTIEDCLARVDNRFALVHLAKLRSKQLMKGSRPFLKCDNREIVTALREIAEGIVFAGSSEKGDQENPLASSNELMEVSNG
jgi:DNA-directed RNA polymerase subunit omega